VLEGITFSLNESIEIFRASGKTINTIISIGGGAKNDDWLQMQADIFKARVQKLSSEQGPGMGAAMLAAVGAGWYISLQECAEKMLQPAKEFEPIPENVTRYEVLYRIYQKVYSQTKTLSEELTQFRK